MIMTATACCASCCACHTIEERNKHTCCMYAMEAGNTPLSKIFAPVATPLETSNRPFQYYPPLVLMVPTPILHYLL